MVMLTSYICNWVKNCLGQRVTVDSQAQELGAPRIIMLNCAVGMNNKNMIPGCTHHGWIC